MPADLTPPVLWSEGLLLTPQHLQQQDRAHAGAMAALWAGTRSSGWGLAQLVLREAGLARGLVDVASVVAVTRDGVFLHADVPGAPRANARLRPSAASGPIAGPLLVFLCLAREIPGQEVIATEAQFLSGQALQRRHLAEDMEARDLFDPRMPDRVTISRLPFLAQLLFAPDGPTGAEARANLEQNFETLPLLRLLPDGEGYRVDPGFLPPAMTLAAWPELRRRLASMADLMMSRIAEILPEAGTRRLQAETGAPQNLPVFIILRSLNEHASALLQAAEFPDLHPEAAYFRLRQAVADLSAFSADVSLRGEVPASAAGPARPALRPYQHDDMGPRFIEAFEVLEHILAGLGTGSQISVELQHAPPSTWAARIPGEFFDGRIRRHFLVVESTMQPSEVERRLKDRKIGTPDEMRALIDSNLFGLKITLLRDRPPGMPDKPGRYVYFEIDTDDPPWRRVVSNRSIQVFCPELAEREVRIRLFREATSN